MTPHESNLTDWLGDHLWALWLSGALLLASAEMLTLDLTLLMLAGGALAGGLTALVFPSAWLAQVVVAVVVSASMLLLLRPVLLDKMRRAPGYRSSLDSLVGSKAVAVEEVTSEGGHVKAGGDEWQARTLNPSMVIQAGQPCDVYEVDGTTLVVYPREPELPPGLGPYGQYSS